MSGSSPGVARNAGFLFVAQMMTWGLTFVTTMFMARHLGARSLGQLQVANSIWAIASILVGFGNQVLATKEIARAPERTAALLSASVVMRTGLHVVGMAVVALYVWLGGYSTDTVAVVFVVGIVSLVGQYSTATRTALQGLERMELISLADVASKFIGMLAIIGVLMLGQGPVMVAATGGVIVGSSLLIQAYYLRRLQPLHIALNWPLLLWSMRAGLPYLMSMLIMVLYSESDALVISLLVDETQLGWYGAALRLFGTLVFLPSIVTTALFPAITRLHQHEPGALVPLMRRSAFWLLAVSLPIGLGTAIIADPLVRLLYGPGFMGTVPVLVALSVTLVFTYQNMLVGQYLIAVDRQNTWTIVMLFSTLAKFVLNLIFIPWAARLFGNGAVGAASGLLLAEMAMTVIGFIMLPKGVIGRDAALILPRLLLAGLGMVAVVAPLRHTFILVPLAAGGLTYIGLLWALRVIPKQDWQMMIALAKSFWLRVSRSVPARSQASG